MKELSNDRLTAYVGGWREKRDLYGANSFEADNVVVYGFHQDDGNNPPTSSLEEFIEWSADYRGRWESLPERVGHIETSRTDAATKQIDKPTPSNPSLEGMDLTLFGYFCHVQPTCFFEEISGHLPARGRDELALPECQINPNQPLFEYACLESFCEYELGPSLRGGLGTLYEQDRRQDFFAADTEQELYDICKGSSEEKNLDWQNLDRLYPDFQERKQRIREFEKNWFPEEIIEARTTYDRIRTHLRGLVGL